MPFFGVGRLAISESLFAADERVPPEAVFAASREVPAEVFAAFFSAALRVVFVSFAALFLPTAEAVFFAAVFGFALFDFADSARFSFA